MKKTRLLVEFRSHRRHHNRRAVVRPERQLSGGCPRDRKTQRVFLDDHPRVGDFIYLRLGSGVRRAGKEIQKKLLGSQRDRRCVYRYVFSGITPSATGGQFGQAYIFKNRESRTATAPPFCGPTSSFTKPR